ncbi:MAG: N-acetylmuramoyl-L-alanine amidase [Suilimivivens sp.]
MKKTAVFSLLFSIIAMGLILYLSAGKVITITDVAQDEVKDTSRDEKNLSQSEDRDNVQAEEVLEENREKNLTFQLGEADSSYLRIPVPGGCKADDITIENHYMDKELWLLIPKTQEDFYEKNPISGNREAVKSGSFEMTGTGITLKFRLTGIYECRTILENDNLYISFLSPSEVYDKIVVIDPAWGGTKTGYTADGLTEKDITLQIARKLKERLDASDIKAYYTRMDDIYSAEEERSALGNETKADMYIRIEANYQEDTSVYGTEAVYNGDYFIPGFGSIELADRLEREVTTAIKGKALGLVEAGEESYVLQKATVPAATIRVGYLSNAQEAILLGREEYMEKIADGIYNAILQIYEDNQ